MRNYQTLLATSRQNSTAKVFNGCCDPQVFWNEKATIGKNKAFLITGLRVNIGMKGTKKWSINRYE